MTDIDNETPLPEEDAAQPQNGQTDPAEKIAKLEAELSESRDRLLRALAETENVRRRGEREREDTARYAISRFAGDILSVADNLHRALESVPASAVEGNDFIAKLIDGVGATERELLKLFEKHGLKRVDPAGQVFDPNFHEVLYEIDSPDVRPGTVIQVLEAGYTIGERLLRPARVAVAKGGPAA